MKLNEFLELKKQFEKDKSNLDRAKGQLDSLKSKLVCEFECNNIEEAKELLTQLEESIKEKEELFDSKISEYHKQYNGKIEG